MINTNNKNIVVFSIQNKPGIHFLLETRGIVYNMHIQYLLMINSYY